jgi:DNA-directed RNA polymerase sigma subunit (sigma70/sigma32)
MEEGQVTKKKNIDFSELMKRLLGLLTEKEQNVISRRFSLEERKKETLDVIGKSYSITRERVRQIEMMALKKLVRISMDPAMRHIHDLAFSILVQHGKVMKEDLLVSEMLKNLENEKKC